MLVEVNLAEEPGKGGCAPAETAALVEALRALPLDVIGLMTVAPQAGDRRGWFAALRDLATALELRELSMGMSDDFEAAIEEGATMVRVGRAIFGDRSAMSGLSAASSTQRDPPIEEAPTVGWQNEEETRMPGMWQKTMVYLGLKDDEEGYEYDYDELTLDEEPADAAYERYERPERVEAAGSAYGSRWPSSRSPGCVRSPWTSRHRSGTRRRRRSGPCPRRRPGCTSSSPTASTTHRRWGTASRPISR